MRVLRLAALICLLPGGSGCGEPDAPGIDAIPRRIETSAAWSEPAALQAVVADAVDRRTGPGGHAYEVAVRTTEHSPGHSRRIGRETFQTALRANTLAKYPCNSCHLGTAVIERERVADAHQNVQAVHPAETGAVCATCHDARNVERLALQSGETASLDQTYRLCAQCHFAQVESWAGGAHGKRLDGWRGRRVVMSCADCHDPHKPSIEKRIPFPGPRLPGGHE